MNSLPVEILSLTLSFLDASTSYNASLVCKGWHSYLSSTPSLSLGDYLCQCARDGNILYLAPLRKKWSTHVSMAAAGSDVHPGSLLCLKYIYEVSGRELLGYAVACEAARRGHLDKLKYLCETMRYSMAHDLAMCAAGGGRGEMSLDCLKYVFSLFNITKENADTLGEAAAVGDVACLQYLCETVGCKLNSSVLVAAAGCNDEHLSLLCLKYLVGRGCELDIDAVDAAASKGHLECLKYLYGDSPLRVWSVHTATVAASWGHLDCLKYVHEQALPILRHHPNILWDANTVKLAAAGGYLGCVKYLVENGCLYTKRAIRAAQKRGHKECEEYLTSHF